MLDFYFVKFLHYAQRLPEKIAIYSIYAIGFFIPIYIIYAWILKKRVEKGISVLKVNIFRYCCREKEGLFSRTLCALFFWVTKNKRGSLHLYKAFPASAVVPLLKDEIKRLKYYRNASNNERLDLEIIVNGTEYGAEWIKDICNGFDVKSINYIVQEDVSLMDGARDCLNIAFMPVPNKGIIKKMENKYGYNPYTYHSLILYEKVENRKFNIISAWTEEFHEGGAAAYHVNYYTREYLDENKGDYNYIKRKFDSLMKIWQECVDRNNSHEVLYRQKRERRARSNVLVDGVFEIIDWNVENSAYKINPIIKLRKVKKPTV